MGPKESGSGELLFKAVCCFTVNDFVCLLEHLIQCKFGELHVANELTYQSVNNVVFAPRNKTRSSVICSLLLLLASITII